MTRLPVISGKELIKALEKTGFKVDGQRGSHVKIKKKTSESVVVTIVPLHKELDPGTLLSILRQAQITREELVHLLEKA